VIGKDEAAKPGIVVTGHLPVASGVDWLIGRSERRVELKRGARLDAYVLDCE
jgi:hypothetical protein